MDAFPLHLVGANWWAPSAVSLSASDQPRMQAVSVNCQWWEARVPDRTRRVMQLWGRNGKRMEYEAAVVAILPATCLQRRPLSLFRRSLFHETHLDLARVGTNGFLPAVPAGFFMTALLGWNLYAI